MIIWLFSTLTLFEISGLSGQNDCKGAAHGMAMKRPWNGSVMALYQNPIVGATIRIVEPTKRLRRRRRLKLPASSAVNELGTGLSIILN